MLYIQMAGLVMALRHRYPYLRFLCSSYRCSSRLPADLTVSVTPAELEAEYEKNPQMGKGCCESLCIYRAIGQTLPVFQGLIVHAAAVEMNERVYLFLAKSGVGKTTHARLWAEVFPGHARILNGDKPIIRRLERGWSVWGTPWQGKEDLGQNRHAPLYALCFLERASENRIEPLMPEEALCRLLPQVYLPHTKELLGPCLDLLADLTAAVPAYRLQCNLHPDAAQVAYDGMRGASPPPSERTDSYDLSKTDCSNHRI